MDSYFSFYGISESFDIDLSDLKKRFYVKSRELHPDFYTQESEEKKEEILRLSAYNNDAYNTLKDEQARMHYILSLYGVLGEEGAQKLDQMFLMEMMDINEALMDIQMETNPEAKQNLITDIESIENTLKVEVSAQMEAFNESQDKALLDSVLEYYLKQKYLLRIRDNLNKFDSL